MHQVGNQIYADEGKVFDFKEPSYALNDKGEKIQVHLYSPVIRLSRADSPDRYVEIDESEVPEEEEYGAASIV